MVLQQDHLAKLRIELKNTSTDNKQSCLQQCTDTSIKIYSP